MSRFQKIATGAAEKKRDVKPASNGFNKFINSLRNGAIDSEKLFVLLDAEFGRSRRR